MSYLRSSLRRDLLATALLTAIAFAVPYSAHAQADDIMGPPPAAAEAPAPQPGERTITFETVETPSDGIPIGTTVHKGKDAATGQNEIEVIKTGEGKFRTVITSAPKNKNKNKSTTKKSYND